MRTIPAEQFKKEFGDQVYRQFGQVGQQTKTQSVQETGGLRLGNKGKLKELWGDIKGVGSDIKKSIVSRTQKSEEIRASRERGEQGRASTVLQDVGNMFGTVSDVTSAVVKGGVKAISSEEEEQGFKKRVTQAGSAVINNIPKIQEWMQQYEELKKTDPVKARNLEAVAQTVEFALNFVGAKAGVQGAKTAIKTGKEIAGEGLEAGIKAVGKVGDIVGGVPKVGEELVKKGKTMLGPPIPSAQQAMGQVLQGQTKDIQAGFKAFKEVDTTGVKSYDDLLTKTTDTITNLSKKVDETLDNTTPLKLKDLQLRGKTKAGQPVSVDYVNRALDHLEELYKSTGDDIAAKNIEEIINKAKTVGLTRLEVNNIARTYGTEFGEKAFSKMGDALTSVNAQKFENTRKFLKEVARKGIGGKKAKEIDESISSLYRVKDLVKKNAQAVTKLNQKIQERGLLEKLGYHAAKVTDVLTGGSLRGILGGLLPRGVGYKVMNALDLEQVLQRNLDVITKALKASDPEVMKLLKKIKSKNPS